MDTRRRPASDQVRAWMLSRIADGTFGPGGYIPSIRDISRICRADKMTVHTVLRLMKKAGILYGEEGARSRVSPNRPDVARVKKEPGDLSSPKAKTRDIILNSVLTGVFALGQKLPAVKNIQSDHHASRGTLHAVLDDLCNEGILETEGRGYRVRAFIPTKPALKVALVAFSYYDSGTAGFIKGHHDPAICGQLSAACASRNLRLELIQSFVDACSHVRFAYDGHPFRPDDATIGYVVLLNTFPPTVKDLFDLLARTGKPVAIIDELGDWDMAVALPSRTAFRAFLFSSGYSAAREVAGALVQRGHRSFLFISPYPYAWSRAREQGIRDELTALGLGDALTTFAFDSTGESDDEGRDVLLPGFIELFRRQVAGVKALPPSFHGPMNDSYFIQGIWENLREVGAQSTIRQGLANITRNNSATSWIAVNDETGWAALDALREQGIGAPQTVSLVSFDDSPRALEQGLSSYNFNVPHLVNAALNFVLDPTLARGADAWKRINIPGLLVERNTSGPARATA